MNRLMRLALTVVLVLAGAVVARAGDVARLQILGFAKGGGIWGDLSRDIREEQLQRMSVLIDELYPSFRLYLFDGRERFSVPYTVFGPYRAAIFVGEMYLVLNTTEAVLTMQRHFDGLIRVAKINAHEVAAYISTLKAE